MILCRQLEQSESLPMHDLESVKLDIVLSSLLITTYIIVWSLLPSLCASAEPAFNPNMESSLFTLSPPFPCNPSADYSVSFG